MIKIHKIKPTIYEVIEIIHCAQETKTTSWYYDLDKELISEKTDFPPSLNGLTRRMSEAQMSDIKGWIDRIGITDKVTYE